MQRSRPERQRLRQRLRAADPSGTGRLDIEPFTTLAAELGIDLLVRPLPLLLPVYCARSPSTYEYHWTVSCS